MSWTNPTRKAFVQELPPFRPDNRHKQKGSSRLEDKLMSNAYRHVELLTGDVRRRRWTIEQKLTIIEHSFEPGETVSSTARRHGVAPKLLYR